MKKLFLTLIMTLSIAMSANAQLMRTKDLEKYAKERYGDKWTEAAANLGATLQLDKNNSLTYSQIIDCGNQTKDQLYVLLNHWTLASLSYNNAGIQLNDKDLGCIIAQGYLYDIARHMSGKNNYSVSIKPIIKIDIKDYRIRVTCTVQHYDIYIVSGGGYAGILTGSDRGNYTEQWLVDECYPFVEKDTRKKTSSKAIIMAHAYSNVLMDKIEEAVKNGITGNEKEIW